MTAAARPPRRAVVGLGGAAIPLTALVVYRARHRFHLGDDMRAEQPEE